MFFQTPLPLEDATGLLQPLLTILVLGGIWLVVRYIFKLALKVFMAGCFVIIVIGAISLVATTLQISP